MLLTIIIGETGSGKSTLAKQIFKSVDHGIVYDVQNEYECQTYQQNKKKFKLSPTDTDTKKLMLYFENCKGYSFFVEECTALFRGTIDKKFTNLILSKRHTKNNFFLIFHSLHRVPMQLMEFCDVLVMFKTNDVEDNIKKKYPKYFDSFKKLQTLPKFSKIIHKQSNLLK